MVAAKDVIAPQTRTRPDFFFNFVLAYSGSCMRLAVFKKNKANKKDTKHERVHISARLSSRGVSYTHVLRSEHQPFWCF